MKDKVIRVSEKEKEILMYLRKNQKEVQQEISKISKNNDISHLKYINTLFNKESYLEDLIKENFITRELFDDILSNVKPDNLIVITGNKQTGKTTLLNLIDENITIPHEKIEIEDLTSFFLFLTYLNNNQKKPIIVTIVGPNWLQAVENLMKNNNLNEEFISNIMNGLKNNNFTNYHTYIVYNALTVYKK